MRHFLTTCLLVGALVVPSVAASHQTALSTLRVDVRPDDRTVELTLTLTPKDVADHLELDPNGDGSLDHDELAEIRPRLADYIRSRLHVANDGQTCGVGVAEWTNTERREATVSFRKRFVCEGELGSIEVTNTVLLDTPEGYSHYSKILIGEHTHTTVFNKRSPSYTFEVPGSQTRAEGDGATSGADGAQSIWSVASTYIWQGILHIVLGLDHVLFVICLLLAAREFRRLVGVVTSFTVAHSVTLALSALDIVTLSPGVVEPLIALSIAWAAAEIVLGHEPGKYLYGLTFGFGLLHGFGFSYVLRDEVGLPADALAGALVSFNVGVELGQLAIVLLAYPLVTWAEDRDWADIAFRVVAGAVLALSVYWFVTRLIG